MARVAKIDNAWKKRFEREETKRPINSRAKLVYFLIICEGEKTEPNYFSSLEKVLPNGTVELEIEGKGLNTLGLVDYAKKQKDNAFRNYDRVWVVFDKDSFPDDNFNNAINKALSHDINCAWTNEAFELWFLLHFQFVSSAMSRSDYKDYLEREIKRRSGDDSYIYLKNDKKTFDILKNYGNQEQAIKWAAKLKKTFTDNRYALHNPCTKVHELIEELLNPEEILKKLESSE